MVRTRKNGIFRVQGFLTAKLEEQQVKVIKSGRGNATPVFVTAANPGQQLSTASKNLSTCKMGGLASRCKAHENEISALKRCLPATCTPVRLSDDDSCYQHSILNTLLNAREFRKAIVRRGNLVKEPASACFTLFGSASWMPRKGPATPNFSRKGQDRKYTTFAPGCSEIDPLWSGQETDTEYFHGIAAANPREDCRFSVCFEDGPSNFHWRVEDVEQTASVLKMQNELLELLENARKCGSVVLCSPQETISKHHIRVPLEAFSGVSQELRPPILSHDIHEDSYAGKTSSTMLSTTLGTNILRSTSSQTTEKLLPFEHVGSRRTLLFSIDNTRAILLRCLNNSGEHLSSSPSDDQRSLDNTMCDPTGRCSSCDENVIAALTKALESETERTQKAAQVQTGADRQDGSPTRGEDLALSWMSAKHPAKHPDLPMSETEICDLLTYGYVCHR